MVYVHEGSQSTASCIHWPALWEASSTLDARLARRHMLTSRERYRRAAELSKVRGKLSCLLINDLDAGLGHFANTQTTVNNQARAFAQSSGLLLTWTGTTSAARSSRSCEG